MKISNKRLFRIFAVILAFACTLYLPFKTFALDDEMLDKFAANNIMFYDPDGCSPSAVVNNTGTVLPGNTPQEKVWNFYAQHGYNDYQIAGIMGNVQEESGFNPVAHSTSFPGVYGLFQFIPANNKKLWDKFAQYDKDNNLSGDNSASYYFQSDHFSSDGDLSLFTNKPGLADAILNIQLEYSISNDWDRTTLVANAAERFKALPPSKDLSGKTIDIDRYPQYYAEVFEIIYEGAVNGNDALEYVLATEFNKYWTDTKYQGLKRRKEYAASFMDQYGNGGEMGGYKVPPATSNGSNTVSEKSGIVWEDGWIKEGTFDGYYKEEVKSKASASSNEYHGDGNFGKDFLTDLPKDKSKKGPNKITLHFTEGGNGNADGNPVTSVKDIYAKYDDNGNESSSGKQIFVSQFTIDLRNERVYQHGSIMKAGSGVRADDRLAGVQIEIIGFGYENSSKLWDLRDKTQFPDDSWNYLAKLLIGIAEETGIPLSKSASIDFSKPATSQAGRLTVDAFTSYSGILGHQHSPDPDRTGSPAHTDPGPDVWNNTAAALRRLGVDPDGSGAISYGSCGSVSSSGSVSALQEAVLKYSHHDYKSDREDPVQAYADLMKERAANGFYTGGAGAHNGIPGIDCGAYVSTMMVVSGWDPEYNYGTELHRDDGKEAGWTGTQIQYLLESPVWEDITSKVVDGEELKAGDVIIYHNGKDGHTLFVAFDKNDNEKHDYTSEATSASYQTRAPGADATRIDRLAAVWVTSSYNGKVFRKR